ncbi:hypothetical protein PPYR_05463 [Photinus pyralis]|uniref:Trafficking protein particle complex subunit 8 n=1 Tax=Photinus pyralis TaxID=7054 RepID=A0A5N4AUW9_PHOPY|nr:trafficking protein particle complex subunit 8 [Photinus pyralis]KAB0801109.1 hypothetical protein PPYR_05463 [Photinus pyralis]
MSHSKLSSQDFIKNTFTPQIAVLCSPAVDSICQKNNLSFTELVQPFCKLNSDVYLQDTNGGVLTIHNLKISLLDVNFRPPQPTLARKFLNACVSQSVEPRTQKYQIGKYNLDVPTSTSWFESWRDTFLQVQFPSDHEFTKHFLACILVAASNEVNPVDTMTRHNQTLSQIQNIIPNKLPKWFHSNVLRYYLIVHDNTTGDSDKATQTLEALKVSYGLSNCFLLRMNSRPPEHTNEQLPDPWSQYVSSTFEVDSVQSSGENSPYGSRTQLAFSENGFGTSCGSSTLPYHPLSPDTECQNLSESLERAPIVPSYRTHGMCLTTEDVEQIKLFIHEFCTRALLPDTERQIQFLTDSVLNKKGVSKSLFSATKRWFTPNKGATNTNGSIQMYAPDSPELIMRKLGDLYFMFGHYNMAFQVYHTAKRDFNSDQAWFYYAGALEMASLAAYMANESTRKTLDYMEESIVTYLNVCKMGQFATRATLLSSECLKGKNLHGEAAHQLIRMTSEESDLRSALLLEQAAYNFLSCTRPQMVRKYAFHMVLAGHRFSKASQKKHALRCYKQALQVYENKSWSFAEDHVHYTIGKLSSALNVLDEAAHSFSMLMTIQSKQSKEQQLLFLKEYLSSQRSLAMSQSENNKVTLVLPILQSESTKILVGPSPPLSIPARVAAVDISLQTPNHSVTVQKWNKLEEMLVQEAQGSLPMIFRPVVVLYSINNINNANIIAIVNEPVQVFLKLYNPLSVTLHLTDLCLYWNLKTSNGNVLSNESSHTVASSYLKTNVIKSLSFESTNSRELILSVVPLVTGDLFIKGLFYTIVNVEPSGEEISVSGKQLLDLNKLGYISKETQKREVEDLGLPISVMPPAPCLQVTFSEINTQMLCDQIHRVSIEIRNIGSEPIHKLLMGTSTPTLLSMCEFENIKTNDYRELEDSETPAVREREARKNHVTQISLPNGQLEAGRSLSINIWLKAPSAKGSVPVDLLLYYENCDRMCNPKYRLIRHEWNLVVHECLAIDLMLTEGCKSEKFKELLFAAKLINMNKFHYNVCVDIMITKAAFLSSLWGLEFVGNSNYFINIQSQQAAYAILRARRHMTPVRTYHEVVLSNTEGKSNMAYLDFAERTDQVRINAFEDEEQITKPKEKEGILFFEWTANFTDHTGSRQKVNGQSSIEIEKLQVEEESDQGDSGVVILYDPIKSSGDSQLLGGESEPSEELKAQVSMCIFNTTHVSHNFDSSQICIVPVQISLHNDSHLTSLVTINTSGVTSESPPQSVRPNVFHQFPSKEFRWVGFSGTVKTIAPKSSEVVILHVAVSFPGVYDLGRRLEHWCQNELYHEPVLQILKALCFLTVSNTND